MLKKVVLGILALTLLALPSVGRWLYFYEGSYQPQVVPRPDLASVEAALPEAGTFSDETVSFGRGLILVDLAHANRVTMAELGVLQARLTARNQQLQSLTVAEDLPALLRQAKALVVVSPGENWTSDEIEQVANFVAKGGRLLMVTDPSRYDYLYDEWDNFLGLDHDIVHINDLAARFGLVFQGDYLYNTSDNEGNYRNIRLNEFADDPLLEGVEQLVFYATHSIVTEEEHLVIAAGETRSSASEWNGPLTVAALAAGGAVLGLGDLTFLAESYNAVYDNDRFLANIADWLSDAQRQYDLADFPFFFQDEVDLVYAGDPLLDGKLLTGGSVLQDFLADQAIRLDVREQADDSRDTIFFGLYDQADEVEPHLAAAEITLLITPTAEIEAEADEEAPLPAATPSLPLTQPLTSTLSITPTATPLAEVEAPAPAKDRVEIGSLGTMIITNTSLLVMERDGQRQVLVVLADKEEGLDNAITRLTEGNLDGCLFHEVETSAIALCPYGEASSDGGWQETQPEPGEPAPLPTDAPTEEPPEPPSEPEGTILILAMDQGQGVYDDTTSAAEYQAILEERYDIDVWSTSADGAPDITRLLEYDLVIWTAGDHREALDEDLSNLLLDLVLEGVPVVMSGAYLGDSTSQAVQRDIQVRDSEHPLAAGFEADEVIPFLAAPSGSEYEVDVLEDFQEGEDVIVFVRGPESEASGAASVAIVEDEINGLRLAFLGFPLYLLPDAARARLVWNTVTWLLSP